LRPLPCPPEGQAASHLKRDTLKTHLEMPQRSPTAKAKGAGIQFGYTHKATDLTGEPTSPCAAKRNVATAAKEAAFHFLTLKITRSRRGLRFLVQGSEIQFPLPHKGKGSIDSAISSSYPADLSILRPISLLPGLPLLKEGLCGDVLSFFIGPKAFPRQRNPTSLVGWVFELN
jgi:hypothetical protein